MIVKSGDLRAEGKNERSAMLALRKKIFESSTEEERIKNFVESYAMNEIHTADEWIEAYQILTGACYVGSHRFIKKMGIKRYDKYSTRQFLQIAKNAQNESIIEKILEKYEEER